MTTNRPEFKAHDDFIFGLKKTAKVTREEFIKYIRTFHEHMRKLSQIIQQYDQTIKEWVSKFELFESAETERVANEEERISKDSERDGKIEAIVEDVSGKLDNKVDASELELYAKKEQEDWITPTMLNGWRGSEGVFFQPVRYMKDNLGFVHINGALTDGEAVEIFKLPVGYRPSNSQVAVYAKNQWDHGAGVWIRILTDGRVGISSTTLPTDTRLSFSCSFYAG